LNHSPFSLLMALLALGCSPAVAQDKKDLPVVRITSPLGIVPGICSPVTIHGFTLNDVSEIRFLDLKSTPLIQIKSKGTAKPPDKVPPEKVGDSQVEIDLTFPPDVPAGVVRFVVVSPQGQSAAHEFVVLDPMKTITEKEPNDGFSKAQEMELGQSIVGTLAPGQNVDVFRFAGKAGQKVRIETQATRFGSLLDPFLLLHNSQGQLLAEIDDSQDSADPVLETVLPADGIYFLSLLDAHDKESPLHCYILTIK